MRSFALVTLLIAVCGCARGAALDATPTTVAAVLAKARPGDVIRLSPGTYSGFNCRNLSFSPPLTITSADREHPATFTTFVVEKATGVTLSYLEFVATPPGNFVFGVMDSIDVHFDHISVHGSMNSNPEDDVEGIGFQNNSNVSITNSEFQQLVRAVAVSTTAGFTFSGNNVHDVEATGLMVGGGSSDVKVIGNVFHDFFPTGGDHPDAIQFLTRGSQIGSKDIEVADNLIYLGRGRPTQGIFFRDQVETLPYTGVVIRDNLIVGTGYGGIYANGLHGGSIAGNVLITYPAPANATPIVVELSDGVLVSNNTASQIGVIDENSKAIKLVGNTSTRPDRSRGSAAIQAFAANHSTMSSLVAPLLATLADGR